MEDESGKPEFRPFVTTERERREALVWRSIRHREFNSGSWERALEKRDRLFKRELEIADVTDIEEKARLAKAAMLEILAEESGLHADRIDRELLTRLSRHILANHSMIGITQTSGDGETPEQKLSQYLGELEEYLRQVGTTVDLEKVYCLMADKGFYIGNPDVERLLLWEINKDRLVPLVLVMPNHHDPINPFPMLVVGDLSVPAMEARILRTFAY